MVRSHLFNTSAIKGVILNQNAPDLFSKPTGELTALPRPMGREWSLVRGKEWKEKGKTGRRRVGKGRKGGETQSFIPQ